MQCRSMRDNLIVSGIPETHGENAQEVLKTFMKTKLNLPVDKVNGIILDRTHRMGKQSATTPRPIITKFKFHQDKIDVMSKGPQLKNTNYGLSHQFPKEINDRRKILVPIMKKARTATKRAYISVDKLYIDDELYKNKDVTPWLY